MPDTTDDGTTVAPPTIPSIPLAPAENTAAMPAAEPHPAQQGQQPPYSSYPQPTQPPQFAQSQFPQPPQFDRSPFGPPVQQGGRLSLAALIVGIVAAVSAVVPGLSFVAFVPAFAAVILGIIGLVRRSRGKGRSIAGICLGAGAFVVAVVVSVFTIAATVGPSIIDQLNSGSSTSGSNPADPLSEPDTDPSIAIPADSVYSGTGDTLLPVVLPDGPDYLAFGTFTHEGSGNFSVWSLDAAAVEQEMVVNTIGSYSGTVAFNLTVDATSSLQITADGPWTVTLTSIEKVPDITGSSASGTGDSVLYYWDGPGTATITHAGEGNFVVSNYGDTDDLIVNEIGAFSGEVPWTTGPSVVMIRADGPWTIDIK